MSKKITYALCLCLSMMLLTTHSLTASSLDLDAETQISGKVVDSRGEPLPGVNITVKGTIVGTPTNGEGNFTLKVRQDPPLTLQVSFIGYQTQEIAIMDNNVSDLLIVMQEQTFLGQGIVVSASRVEESVLEAPVTIEKMDVLAIKNTASDDYYKAIASLKGVDVTTSSVNFQIINARGFNSTGNTRMVQLIDGMDTQAPALNFPIGNLNGPSELDVESIEFIPGASSALYGPNAFNGILLINSKDPFQYQGLSVMVKSGINHVDGDAAAGEPENPQPMYTTSLRYAKAFNNKFAFKANFSYMQAQDWTGTNYTDKNAQYKGSLDRNPGFDGVHMYGDDGGINIALLGADPTTRATLAGMIAAQTGVPASMVEPYVGSLPNRPVHRTGYLEKDLSDYDAKNMKINTSLHYRITDLVEASYSFNYGSGTSIYTGAQRYSLKNFFIQQHKLELKGDNFMVRAYGTFEDSGDSYIADFVGYSVNDQYLDNNSWFGTYGATFAGGLMQAAAGAQGGNPTYNAATVNAILNNPTYASQLHGAARQAADANRYEPGTAAFDNAVKKAMESTIPDGARFNDESNFYHAEGQYDFKNEIDFIDLQLGLSFRQYQLRSHGTIFDDKNGVDINEYGGYLQGSKSLLDDRVKLTGSVRYDKNENFTGQFNPRISAVINTIKNQNLRASYQTGFRNPDTQAQYIDLNVITARLLGGLPYLAEKYKITENAFTLESVEKFTSKLLIGDPAASLELKPVTSFKAVKPEQIQSFEVGYKGLFGENVFFDVAYYYNIYNDFIAQYRIRKAAGPFTGNPANDQLMAASLLKGDATNTYQVYTNLEKKVESQGAVVGVDVSLPSNYNVGGNYNWNKLITDQGGQYVFDFNTPEHKMNIYLRNRNVFKNIGFNVNWRWQDEFEWVSSFADGTVPAYSTIDAQVSYTIPQYSAVVKVGGSNITNNRYIASYGSPSIGAIYYVSLTFDQLFR